MIVFRAVTTVLSRNPRRKQRDSKPERVQQGSKRSIQFIAESTSPFANDLRGRALLVDDDLALASNVEVFKRHCEEMGTLQCPQGLSIGVKRPGIADARQVSSRVHSYCRLRIALVRCCFSDRRSARLIVFIVRLSAMKALVISRLSGPEGIEVREVPEPQVGPNQV